MYGKGRWCGFISPPPLLADWNVDMTGTSGATVDLRVKPDVEADVPTTEV